MKLMTRHLSLACCLAFAVGSARPQTAMGIKLKNIEIGGGAIGQYTTNMGQDPSAYQTTTDSFGGEFTLRARPVSWVGLEFNYAYTAYQEKFALTKAYTTVRTGTHEATGAYLIRAHIRKLQPFIALGGGCIDFVPEPGPNQWRGAGLLEVGLDIPASNPHMGFRVQGRALVFREPQFYSSSFGNSNWAISEEPSAGVWYRW